MVGRLRQFGQLGWAWLTTTPKGRNWIWQRFVQNADENYKRYQLLTRHNPFLDRRIYETWSQSYAGDFARQELEGEFVAFEGLVYPEFSREKHMSVRAEHERYKYYIAGMDWGYNNPGVFLVAGVDGDDKMTIVYEDYQRQRQIGDWVEAVKQINSLYPLEVLWCDPSEPDYIRMFAEAGINAQAADNTVRAGIQAVKARLMTKRLTLTSAAANTAAEFEQYQWLGGRGGQSAFEDRPLKANDHAMDALRYMVYNHDSRGGEIGVRVSDYA
jgi:PBSX family phage terminase large subunit